MAERTELKPMRVLFVCFGNSCRSPMAAGLAMKILGNLAVFESAGISPGDSKANDKTIEVMREMGIDISDHCSRRVSSLNLTDFDYIITMDLNVNLQLKSLLSGRPAKILSWEVDDPWGRDIEDYRECAETIRMKVFGLRKFLEEAEGHHP
jgi:protein-tyrosine-phosphatase